MIKEEYQNRMIESLTDNIHAKPLLTLPVSDDTMGRVKPDVDFSGLAIFATQLPAGCCVAFFIIMNRRNQPMNKTFMKEKVAGEH